MTASADDMTAGRSVTVVQPGWGTTFQDGGRRGWAHLGVNPSGAMDARAAALANRLVGNVDSDSVFETAGALRLQADVPVAVAVTGARGRVTVDGHEAPWDMPVFMRSGSQLVIGHAAPRTGRWSYVAVRGGLAPPRELGSRSTDTLSGLGPRPPVAGQRVPVGDDPRSVMAGQVVATPPWSDAAVGVRVWPGPRRDRLPPEAWAALTSNVWSLSTQSDRIGYRLDGPALTTISVSPLPSEGLVAGAIQIPADGRPIVMMRDHPTTGGYPVVAVVDPDDLGVLAQRQPGEAVLFVPVTDGRTSL